MMQRLFPAPLLSVFLLGLWLLLNQTTSIGHVLLGGALAIYGPWATASLRPVRARVRRPVAALRLIGRVAVDIVKSNIAVGWLILSGRRSQHNSGFMQVPLKMRDSHALAALSCIITGCPGTVWAGLTADGKTFTIHVLDLKDEAEWIDTVQNRYEKLLMEIFE